MADRKAIYRFVDFWLSGGAKKLGLKGGSTDCFIPHTQQSSYIRRYHVYLLFDSRDLIGWAVINLHGVLIHFLIHGDYRGKGIGGWWLRELKPLGIRSKTNQKTGNPTPFYEKLGYTVTKRVSSVPRFGIDPDDPTREKIIDIMELPAEIRPHEDEFVFFPLFAPENRHRNPAE